MTVHISKSKFKAKALEIFRQVETSGESVIVTDRGRPALQLSPYKQEQPDVRERLRGSVIRSGDLLSPISEGEWEATQ